MGEISDPRGLSANAEAVLEARYLRRDAGGRRVEDFEGLCQRVAVAVAEAESAWDGPVQVLRGGTEGWREAGLPIEEGAEFMAGPPDDVYLKPYEHCEDPEGAMRRYLAWEVDLLGQVLRDGDARFRYTPPN